MFEIGEKPGEGTYKCVKCKQWEVSLEDGEGLPPCPKCESDKEVVYSRMIE